MSLTISREQRDAIYDLVVTHLTGIGDVWITPENRDTSCGTRALPRTPVAPATKTFMTAPLVSVALVRRDRGAACDSAQRVGVC
jgi:hypothetical protein